MCENFPNIRVTEGNAFALLLPLRTRTYVSSQPIDEDIDYTQLENIVFTFGGVEYATEATEQGVKIILPDTLAVGTYNAILTAEYLGNEIRAAYESAVTIVSWSEQSSAEQYIVGSPIVMRAAYVLSGAMTDAELEALKEEYREKNAQLEQAIAEAEEAKREWEQKAADLDGVAQESTSQQILDAVEVLPSLQDMKDAGILQVSYDGVKFNTPLTFRKLSDIIFNIDGLEEIVDNDVTIITTNLNFKPLRNVGQNFVGLKNLRKIVAQNCVSIPYDFLEADQYVLQLLEYVDLRSVTRFFYRTFFGCTNLKYVNVLKAVGDNVGEFMNCPNLIDIVYGAGLTGSNAALNSWSPDNALSSSSSSLVDPDETFANNLEKLLYNIREHIAANLPDRTGLSSLTLTMSAAVKAAINGDTATADAFTNKNWIIA